MGVKGVPISPDRYAAGNPEPAEAEQIHSVGVLGVPLFGFRPYTRSIFYVNGEGGYPTDWLKLRSWLWPGLLLNGGKLDRLCGNSNQPCWVPEDRDQDVYGRASNLELVNADGEWRYRILKADGTPTHFPGEPDGTYAYSGYYRLTIGIVSKLGLLYWVLAGLLAILVADRLRRQAAITA